jgi:hypothetical protein
MHVCANAFEIKTMTNCLVTRKRVKCSFQFSPSLQSRVKRSLKGMKRKTMMRGKLFACVFFLATTFHHDDVLRFTNYRLGMIDGNWKFLLLSSIGFVRQ